jgi:hypothetical protein
MLSLEAAREASQGKVPITVEAVDANAEAITFLRTMFRNQNEVTVHEAAVIGAEKLPSSNRDTGAPELQPSSLAKLQAKCDIIVSEVFGSFGDNEFLPEITAEASFFASSRAIFIPSSWQ